MNSTLDMTTELTTLRGLAKRLRLPANWLKDEVDAGRLPVLHAGRRLLFNPTAVERVLLDRAAEMSNATIAKCPDERSAFEPDPVKSGSGDV